jgi:hypothetical protein
MNIIKILFKKIKIKKTERLFKNKNLFLIFIVILMLIFSCKSIEDFEMNKINDFQNKSVKYDLKKYALEDFDALEKKIDELKNIDQTKNNFKKTQIINEIKKQYTNILKKTLPTCSNEKYDITKKIKDDADELKANIALKDKYVIAKKTFYDADKYREEKKYDKSIELFLEAEEKFKEIYLETKSKKDRVTSAVEDLEKKLKDLENNNQEINK